MGEDHHRPSLVFCVRLEDWCVLSYRDRDVVEVVREISSTISCAQLVSAKDSRNEVCQYRTSAQELGICRNVSSLRRWEPIDVLFPFRIRLARVENSVLDSRDALIGRGTGTIEVGYWELDIDGTNLVRAGVFGEAWHRAQT